MPVSSRPVLTLVPGAGLRHCPLQPRGIITAFVCLTPALAGGVLEGGDGLVTLRLQHSPGPQWAWRRLAEDVPAEGAVREGERRERTRGRRE